MCCTQQIATKNKFYFHFLLFYHSSSYLFIVEEHYTATCENLRGVMLKCLSANDKPKEKKQKSALTIETGILADCFVPFLSVQYPIGVCIGIPDGTYV